MRDDDASLVRSAQRGDRAALAAVLKRHERTLFSSAHAMLRSSWDAEDAVQETMYKRAPSSGRCVSRTASEPG